MSIGRFDKVPGGEFVRFMQVTLILLRDSEKDETRLWYAEGMPVAAESGADKSWQPLKQLTRKAGRWQVWFWTRTLSLSELDDWLSSLAADRALKTDTLAIPVALRERSLVFLAEGEYESPLCPVAGESAWLSEMWDQEKQVLRLGNEEWIRLVNSAVNDAIGLDLNYWRDRIGNVLVFFPTGVFTDWHYDDISQSAVIRSNVSAEEAQKYEIELECWDGEEISYWRRVSTSGALVVFDGLPLPDRALVRVLRNGALVHEQGLSGIIKSIIVRIHGLAGLRGGKAYTRRLSDTRVGERSDPTWDRLQRDRRVWNRRRALAEGREFKFYRPDVAGDSSKSRQEAVNDLRALLGRALGGVAIWDAYFAKGDTDFLESVTNLDVRIRVLTSAEDWSESGGSEKLRGLGERIEEMRKAFPARFKGVTCRAWVRGGDTTFHD